MNKIFKKHDDIVTRKIADEVILVPLKGKLAEMQTIFSVDSVSELIWNSIDGKMSLDEIVRKVTNEYNVNEEVATEDLLEFITELKNAALIEEI